MWTQTLSIKSPLGGCGEGPGMPALHKFHDDQNEIT